MKLLVLLFVGIIQFSDEKPTTTVDTTTSERPEDTSSIATESSLTPEIGNEAKTISSTEETVKNSSEVEKPLPSEVQLPVDLLSGDILLDPSVILARVNRNARSVKTEELYGPIGDSPDVENGIPTFYFLRFVRVPRSVDDPEFEYEKTGLYRKPEEPEETRRRTRLSRSAENEEDADLHGADDGFIIRPLFKYRHERLNRSKNKRYGNRDIYVYYPRYPVFPGK